MVTDFVTLNEFGGDGSDHQVAAVRTARRIGESAGGGELRPTFMKQHVTASLSSRSMPVTTGASWQGRDALMKVWWPKRQTFATHTNATFMHQIDSSGVTMTIPCVRCSGQIFDT
jgi:hypothetical protein